MNIYICTSQRRLELVNVIVAANNEREALDLCEEKWWSFVWYPANVKVIKQASSSLSEPAILNDQKLQLR